MLGTPRSLLSSHYEPAARTCYDVEEARSSKARCSLQLLIGMRFVVLLGVMTLLRGKFHYLCELKYGWFLI